MGKDQQTPSNYNVTTFVTLPPENHHFPVSPTMANPLPDLPELPVDAVLVVYTHRSISQSHIHDNGGYANIGETQTKATALLILHHIEPPLSGIELNVSNNMISVYNKYIQPSTGQARAAIKRQFYPTLRKRLRSWRKTKNASETSRTGVGVHPSMFFFFSQERR